MSVIRIPDIKTMMENLHQNLISKVVCTIRLKRRETREEKDGIPWVIGLTPKSIYLIDQTDVDDKVPAPNKVVSNLSEVLTSMALLNLVRVVGSLLQLHPHRPQTFKGGRKP